MIISSEGVINCKCGSHFDADNVVTLTTIDRHGASSDSYVVCNDCYVKVMDILHIEANND